MSISMDRFAATGQFATFDPHQSPLGAVAVFSLQCRCCGYEPDESVSPPKRCPKCSSDAWERFARPGSILSNSERY
jgi:rubrerythrin